jgi:hypothetical protein
MKGFYYSFGSLQDSSRFSIHVSNNGEESIGTAHPHAEAGGYLLYSVKLPKYYFI